MSAAPKKIVIAAGGTAGHVVPALAVADALQAEGARVTFIGGQRAEAELVPQAGYPLLSLRVEGLSRRNPLRALRALALAAAATARARAQLSRLAPDAVMGGGGYVAGPVGVAALSLGIPLVLTEADSHLGLTNRVLARRARRVCLAFALPGREGERYRVTGRPVPLVVHDREAARARLRIPRDATCVLVFGGSLGARSINLAAVDAFADTDFHVLHIGGRRDYAELVTRVGEASSGAGHATGPAAGAPGRSATGYHLIEYLAVHEFADALAAADLAVARAGGSVFEIAAHGLPSILVPYPYASADHQSENARWLADAGAAVVIADAELSAERLREQVVALLGDRERLAAMAAAARGLARADAANEVARELLAAAAFDPAGPARGRGGRPR